VAQTNGFTKGDILAWPIPALFSALNSIIKDRKCQEVKIYFYSFIFGLDFSVVILYTIYERKGQAQIASWWQLGSYL
jgi:hypothetical protein